jgi:hypothetical protein
LDHELARARKLVETVVASLGIEPKVAFAKQDDASVSWTLQRGSAAIFVTLISRPTSPDGAVRTYLRVASPVLELGPPEGHERLFRHLLVLNAAGLANAAFGLIGDRVVVVSERPTEDLQRGEVEQTIRHLAAIADTYDNRLEAKFGGGAPKA